MQTGTSQGQSSQDWKTKKVDNFVVVNKKLGKGQFGTVYRGHYKDDQTKQVAIKTIPMHVVQNSESLQQHIKREIAILTKIDHPNIVKLIHVTKTSSNLYMILEFCKDGDLAEYLNKKLDKRLSELEAVIFFKHVIKGFEILHQEKVIHRDIKPSNILLNDGVAKIADFGFARIIESEIDKMNLSRVGSPIYMAPQILEGTHFTSKCDIWSIGVMFYELLYGVTPWMANGQCELLEKITTQSLQFPEIPVRSQKVKNLLKRMLTVNEADRISWEDLFTNEIIVIDENQIHYNMQQMEKEKDRLMRSISLNKIYINQNLILGYMKDINKIDEEQSENQTNTQQPIYNDIFQQYNAESEESKTIQKLNTICKYERNLAFFYSFLIQGLFAMLQQNIMPISIELCFQLIFCISKNQLIKMEELYREITKSQNPEYEIYMRSHEFKQMCKHLQMDIDQAMKFFVEILRKCLSLQNQAKQIVLNEQTKEFYQQYLSILDNSLTLTDQFQSVYYGTVKLVLDKLTQDTVELMKLKFYLNICLNPKTIFTDYNYDFSRFYEEIQYATAEDWKKALKKFN
ncbi:unnamed protein product [Paramecium sonneborni]|uniref:Protein kinase domain-containing protein n=1 Tax=Paramecium sonneborni TaxID=65129 RepID=A0A8S1R5I3_9CILI|nr:unnamed protein product [Paramecium sonneborni]